MKLLDEAGVRLKLEKCRIDQRNTHWLGYQITENAVKPVEKNDPSDHGKNKTEKLKGT